MPKWCAAVALAMLAGCPSSSGLKTHPVGGQVELSGGNISLLKGSNIDLMQDADPMIRPTSVLAEDGSFSLETLYNGEIVSGAPEGSYKVRIILADEGEEGIPKRPANLLHRRYFDFETSGLKLTVPSSDYKIELSTK